MSEYYEDIKPYDPLNPEREEITRSKRIKLWGGTLAEEFEAIEEAVQEILSEWPEVKREDIRMSTEAEPEPYESWYIGMLEFSWETLETDDEYKSRLEEAGQDKASEIEIMKRTLTKYYPGFNIGELDKWVK